MSVVIGTSGWQYDHWRGTFYPEGVAKTRWLEHYAQRFATVEVNNTFYRLPEARTFVDWAARTPEDFVFAVKASRFLTHVRRLRDPEEPVQRLVDRLESLGDRQGPVLLQLPPTLEIDCDLLDETLSAFPRSTRLAVEPRHPSWFVDDLRRLLERRGAALCLSDTAGRHPPLWRTTDWGYIRFHRGRALPPPCYGRQALAGWAERIRSLWSSTDTVHCYFNNDERGCAPSDARRFALAVRRQGLVPTRTPGARELSVARG
jgi:uncharacterized protein YecE (DUF72 family)